MRHTILVFLLVLFGVPGTLPASEPAPRIHKPIPQAAVAALLAGGGLLLSPRRQDIPAEGLDPAGISWGIDRDSVRPKDASAYLASDRFLYASVAYPMAATLALGGSGDLRSAGVLTQAEASLFAAGVTTLVKVATSRPRPYAYVPIETRTDEGSSWTPSKGTFESFPSGHATLAWASTLSGAMFLARARPDLPPAAHAANGFLCGAIATTTALLRVEGGAHFPTDVVTGSAIGAGIGIVVPLLQVPARPGSAEATRLSLAGVAAGTVAALLVSPVTSPF